MVIGCMSRKHPAEATMLSIIGLFLLQGTVRHRCGAPEQEREYEDRRGSICEFGYRAERVS
ncbi:MAG: hypothetical protein JWQ55_6902 [Rhodopila sp.]|jgi:hypothetical protein|nr:hypothetical protein [Rhodopila sp.]